MNDNLIDPIAGCIPHTCAAWERFKEDGIKGHIDFLGICFQTNSDFFWTCDKGHGHVIIVPFIEDGDFGYMHTEKIRQACTISSDLIFARKGLLYKIVDDEDWGQRIYQISYLKDEIEAMAALSVNCNMERMDCFGLYENMNKGRGVTRYVWGFFGPDKKFYGYSLAPNETIVFGRHPTCMRLEPGCTIKFKEREFYFTSIKGIQTLVPA